MTARPTVTRPAAAVAALPATRALLTAGLLAGPLYVGVGILEMLIRPGFDLRRHSLSLLSNGDLGWIHITVFLVTGALTMAGALGLRRSLRGGRGGTGAPLLLALYGLGLIGAGLFRADPALGFPLGTPADANTVTTAGLLHLVCGAVGFLGFIAAGLLLARRFAGQRQPGWAWFSALTGLLFFAAFAGIVSGSQSGPAVVTVVNLAFSLAVVLGWAWHSALAARQLSELSS